MSDLQRTALLQALESRAIEYVDAIRRETREARQAALAKLATAAMNYASRVYHTMPQVWMDYGENIELRDENQRLRAAVNALADGFLPAEVNKGRENGLLAEILGTGGES